MADWSGSHDMDILHRLGIVDKKREPSDEEVGVMMTASEGETPDSDDDSPIVFDRDTLLRSSLGGGVARNNRMNGESRIALVFRGLLVCTAFFTIGLCLSIVGPTLPDLQLKTNSSSLRSVMTLICANGFGTVFGVSLGGSCFTVINPFCVMTVSLLLCAASTLIIPWCSSLTGVIIIFIVQGVSLGVLERGGYSMFYAYWRRRYHVIQLFYFALAVGALVGPLITTPFVFNKAGSVLPLNATEVLLADQTTESGDQLYRIHRDRRAATEDPAASALRDSSIDFYLGNETEVSDPFGNSTDVAMMTATPPARKPKIASGLEKPGDDAPNTKEKEQAQKKEEAEKAAAASATTTTLATTAFMNGSQVSTLGSNRSQSITPTSPSVTFPPANSQAPVRTSPTSSSSSRASPTITTTVKSTTRNIPSTPMALFPPRKNNGREDNNPVKDSRASNDEKNSNHSIGHSGHYSPSSTERSIETTEQPLEEEENPTLRQDLWRYVLRRVDEVNRVRFAYLVVSLMSTVSTVGFAMMCCCMPCRSLRLPPVHPDEYKFNPRSLCTNRHVFWTSALGLLLAFFIVGMESTIYNLLTVYVLKWQKGQTQLQAVLLTSVFWLAVAVVRLFVAFSGRLVSLPMVITVGVVGSLFSTAALSVFASDSWTVLWLGTAGLGLFVGPIFPATFCWLDKQLNLASWMSTAWLCMAHIGRMTIPPATGAIMEIRNSTSTIILSILVCTLISGLIWFCLHRVGRLANQILAVDAFSRQLKQNANGRDPEDEGFGYRRMPTSDGGDSTDHDGIDMDQMDDFLFQKPEHGENGWGAGNLNDGAFANYARKTTQRL